MQSQVIINNANSSSIWGIPIPILQIALSILIPIFIFYLGNLNSKIKAKKSELRRLSELKEYFLLWLTQILDFIDKQNEQYKHYCSDLYKLDNMGGIPYVHVNLFIENLSSLSDTDFYKIWIEQSEGDLKSNSKQLIRYARKIKFIDNATSQLRDEHKDFIAYLIELRQQWNDNFGEFHKTKHELVKNIPNVDYPLRDFAVSINTLFEKWVRSSSNTSLRESFLFIKEVEDTSQLQYGITPNEPIVSDLLSASQGIIITYKMYVQHKITYFNKFKTYYREIKETNNDLKSIRGDFSKTQFLSWKQIKTY